MSRQFNEHMENRFDYHGEEYELIEPNSTSEFVRALHVKEVLQRLLAEFLHDEDTSVQEELLQTQEDYIQDYIDSLGEFDNTTLAKNITFLAKRMGIRVGALEDLLNISTGYLSRTTKENSKKRMSVDVLWKLAKIFEIDILSLVESELWIPHSNTDLVTRFLERLYQDTKDNYLSWERGGGVVYELNERYSNMELVSIDDDERVEYYPDHLDFTKNWVLSDDIVFLRRFEGDKDLVVIPYKSDYDDNLRGYDFLFVWKESAEWKWERVFSTSDDPFNVAREKADELYALIEEAEFDTKLTPKMHRIMTMYVEGGRPDDE